MQLTPARSSCPTRGQPAKHILRYLEGTSNVGLTYSKQPKELANRLYGYVDADHALDSDDHKSVGGYVLMLAVQQSPGPATRSRS
jgi:hypothetical protein